MSKVNYTVKAELDANSNRQGLHSIYIRVTAKRQRIRIGIGKAIDMKWWNPDKGSMKPGHPLSGVINELVRKRSNDIESYIFSEQIKGNDPTLASIKSIYSGSGNQELSVIKVYVEKLKEQMRGKFVEGTIFNYSNEMNHIESYSPGIRFDQVDHKWLTGFEVYIREKGFKHNSIHKAFKTLVKFFNSAIKDGVTTNYPFKTFERPKYKQGDRTYLTSQEVEKIEKALKLPMDHRLRRTALWFLLGCYSGLRFSDWRRFDPKVMIQGKDIIIRAKKNGQLVVMPIHPKLKAIIKQLPEASPVEAEPTTNLMLKGLAKLCKIEKNLTTHVARHSFAVRCAELGISIETTAELLGINVKTAQIYYKVTGTKVRKEMEKWR